jgi:hypothetical protein
MASELLYENAGEVNLMDDPRAPYDQQRPLLRLIRGGRTVFGGRTAVFGKWVPRIMARMRSRHYDSLLVAGACVHRGTALEWHAKRITGSGECNALRMMLFKVFLDAVEERGIFSSTPALDAKNVCGAQPLIDAIAYRLVAPEPVTARGIAELRTLIFDRDGPFNLNGHGDLYSRLASAFALL